jgi:hypothetical protein
MSYIELINNFWTKDIEYNFSDREIALYFYLLKVSNSISWRNPFGLSSSMTTAKFGWGKKSFDTAKNRLKIAGLITFSPGDGRGNVYKYKITGSEREKEDEKECGKGNRKNTLSGTLSAHLSGTLSEQKGATSIDIDIDKSLNPLTPPFGETGDVPVKTGDVPSKTWRDDFEVYLTDLRAAYGAAVIDTAYITERAKYHPGLNIRLSLEKSCKEFWATPAGWKHKKKSKSDGLNWRATFTKSLDQKFNHVWLQKGETNETGEQKKISYI